MASYGERRRHFRVAQKEAAKSTGKVITIPKKHKNYIVAVAGACSAFFLMLGTLFGIFISRD